MIHAQDLEKIRLIDHVLNAMPIEDIKEMLGAYIIIDKLKGTEDRKGPVFQVIDQILRLESEVMMTKAECSVLKNDIQLLVRCLSKGMGDPTIYSDFTAIKQRCGIY